MEFFYGSPVSQLQTNDNGKEIITETPSSNGKLSNLIYDEEVTFSTSASAAHRFRLKFYRPDKIAPSTNFLTL